MDEHGLEVRHFSPSYCVLLLAKLILSNWFKTLFLSRKYIRRYSFKNTFVTDFNILLTRTIYNDRLRVDKRLLSRISGTDLIALTFSTLLLTRPGEKLFFLPRIHSRRFVGPWFGVIAGGTGDRAPPRSKTAATFNFKHGMARQK